MFHRTLINDAENAKQQGYTFVAFIAGHKLSCVLFEGYEAWIHDL